MDERQGAGEVRTLAEGEAVAVPLGDSTIDVALPDCDVAVAEPRGGEPVDVASATEDALDDPAGPQLAELASDATDVAIAVTDVTRATPDDVLLDAMLDRLTASGIDRSDVTVVVGLGLHRPMSDEELERAYGEHADLVVNHDPEAAVEVGSIEAPDGSSVQIEVHPAIADADLVCATGMVEPHQYAGFSGGAKTVAIGCGGESLIRYTHGPELLGRDGVRLGRVRDNPFRELVDRAGDLVGPEFCLNVTHGPSGILGVRAGAPRRVVRELADVAREALAVPVAEEYDAVVAGVGAPKDASLYQASRAATYVALGDRNPLRGGADEQPGVGAPRGRIVVPARLEEGAGQGTGEQRFYEWLSGGDSPAAVVEAMREGYEPGAQRAFVLARVLTEHEVAITDCEVPDVVEACHLVARAAVAEAVEPGSDVLVVPHAIDTLLVPPES